MPRRRAIPPGWTDLGNGLMRNAEGVAAQVCWDDDDNDAQARGRRAYLERTPYAACPYPADSTLAEAWREGWCIAKAYRID